MVENQSHIIFNTNLLRVFIFWLLFRHVSALAVEHLQGAHKCCDVFRLCFKLYERNCT